MIIVIRDPDPENSGQDDKVILDDKPERIKEIFILSPAVRPLKHKAICYMDIKLSTLMLKM